MNPTLWSVAVAAFWAAVSGAAVWFATIPVRRRSLGGLLASVVLIGAVASVAALVASLRSMFVTSMQVQAAVVIAVVAGGVSGCAAAVAAWQLARDQRGLRQAVADLSAGLVPQEDGPRLSSQLERIRSELAMTARRLADSRDREQALESSRRELVAWVSHDLRAPLAGIRAMSEALEDGVVETPELYYKQIHISVDNLTRMVDDLFELSRIQAGRLTPMTEMLNGADLVSDCLASLGPLALERGVTLTGGTEGTATLRGSARELNRALTNLLSNAIRHTHDGGAIEVRLRGGEQVGISVRDECGGIPADELPRLFDVGFRGELARTPGDAGAGLGLAIARGIAEAHGGGLQVENVTGGCRFLMVLPGAA